MKIDGLHHVTIRVHDPSRSRKFYEDVVGLMFTEIPVSEDIVKEWKGSPTEGALLAAQAGSTL